MEKLAKKFAKHLDNNSFFEAQRMLSFDCCYEFRGNVIDGPKEIIDCYRGSFDSVADQLDQIIFESEVIHLSEGIFLMNFTDKISKNGLWHEHKCQQKVFFENNLIDKIVHIDIDGEVRKLEEFFRTHGVVRKLNERGTF